MEPINERIRKAREALGISQTEFAEQANRTRSEISNIEYGKTVPKEYVIKAICSAHNINRRYLELGEEPMFLPDPDPDTDYINALLESCDSSFVDIIRAIMRVYVELPPEDQKKADGFARSLKDKLNSKDRD